MENKEIILKKVDNSIVGFLRSSSFGIILLFMFTALESFFAYTVFISTGSAAFGILTFPIALIYSFAMFGTVMFFALRQNTNMVLFFIIFELLLNIGLDVIKILHSKEVIESIVLVFLMQVLIGTVIPFSVKQFANEINKKVKSSTRNKNNKLELEEE
jgi:hypothetical protein